MIHTRMTSRNANGSIHSHPVPRMTAVQAMHNASVKRYANVYTGCLADGNLKQVHAAVVPPNPQRKPRTVPRV